MTYLALIVAVIAIFGMWVGARVMIFLRNATSVNPNNAIDLLVQEEIELWNEYRQANPDFSPRISHMRFIDKKMSGVDLSNSTIDVTAFHKSDLRGANFRNSKITDTSFIKCKIDNANFQGAEPTRVRIQESTGQASFDAKMKREVVLSSALERTKNAEGDFIDITDNMLQIGISPKIIVDKDTSIDFGEYQVATTERLAKSVVQDGELLDVLPFDQFADIVSYLFELRGYKVGTTTIASQTGLLQEDWPIITASLSEGDHERRILLDVKNTPKDIVCGVSTVRGAVARMKRYHLSEVAIIVRGDFSQDARYFAARPDFSVTLWSGSDIRRTLSELLATADKDSDS